MEEKRTQLIEKLVVTGHLSVRERSDLGSASVRWSEVAAVIKRVLNETGGFPAGAKPWERGNAVHEGALLQRSPEGKILLIQQRHLPWDATQLAEQNLTEFNTTESAVRTFISKEWPNSPWQISFEPM